MCESRALSGLSRLSHTASAPARKVPGVRVGFEAFFVVGNANKKGSIELIFKQYLDSCCKERDKLKHMHSNAILSPSLSRSAHYKPHI